MSRIPSVSMIWLLILGGCGGAVERIPLEDPRLPAEARRWIADAEDAVVVARARQSASRSRLDQVQRWRQAVTAAGFSGPGAATAQQVRASMAGARVREAVLDVGMANAKVELVHARLRLAYAEVSVRHDIKVYDLAPLQKKVDALSDRFSRARTTLMAAKDAALGESDAWWKAWRELVTKEADTRPFWNTGAR